MFSSMQMDTELPDPVMQVPGLDAEQGMRRMLNKRPLYLAILRRYVDGQRDCDAQIRAALSGGDWTTAERIAHTARGVAGTIGAETVAQKAGQVEAALRNREPETIESLLDALGASLRPLIAGLESTLAAS